MEEKESLVAKLEEEEDEEEDEKKVEKESTKPVAKAVKKVVQHAKVEKTKSILRFGCIPKRPPKDKEDFSKYVDYEKNVAPREDIVRSGHENYQTLFAANDVETGAFTVNGLGAPNDSTTVCGCENTSCPFCNLVLSISNRDPSADTEWASRRATKTFL